MTWKSHTAIAAAIALPFNPALLPVAALGATAPDWLEWGLKAIGRRVEHRTITHYLVIPIALIAVSAIADFHGVLFWFAIGYLTHWIADALTITGVPIGPWDSHKIVLIGGRIRTGDMIEYVISFGLLAASVLIAAPISSFLSGDRAAFNPYAINYRELHDQAVIDNKEAIETRFKFF